MSASVSRRRILSVRERENFRNEIRDRERMLRGQIVVPDTKSSEGMSVRREGRYSEFMDPLVKEDAGLLRAQIKRYKDKLERGSPRNLTRRERSVLEKQVNADRDYLKNNMVNKNLYYKKSLDPEFQKAVDAVSKSEISNPEFQKRAERFKNNMRELDPDNPNSCNIEKLRPES